MNSNAIEKSTDNTPVATQTVTITFQTSGHEE